jgi:beta-phosphoglucomutase
MIRAIIFDLDGVLLDAREIHFHALNSALSKYDQIIAREEHLSRFDGLPTKEKLNILTAENKLAIETHAGIQYSKQIETIRQINLQVTPNPNHVEALTKLRKSGYKLSLASNSIRETVDVALEATELSQFFLFTHSSSDVIRPKPDPEVYLKSIEEFGDHLSASEILVVEDNDHGVAAARAAGAHVLKVANVSEVTYKRIVQRISEIDGLDLQ